MKYRLFFTIVMSLALGSQAIAQTPPESPQKPLYQPRGNEATVVGSITVNGIVPKPLLLDMWADPVCVKLNHKPKTESLITNEQRLVNAFVYLMGEPLKAYRFELPDTAVVLQRQNCRYSPHVLGVRVG